MREFDKPIGRVWRRLRMQRFLATIVWSWAACLAVAAVALAVEKLARYPIPGADWVPFAVAGGVGLVVAALIAAFTGPSRVDAAVAIDHEFGLNERLSTTLTLPTDLLDTSAGRALVADTLKHVNGLDIGSKFGLRMPRRAWLPVVPAVLALVVLAAPDVLQKTARASKSADPVSKEDVVKSSKTLGKSIAQQREKLDKAKFAETEKLLAEIEKAAEQLAKSPPAEKGKAMAELNKLTDALKERQKQLGGAEQINKQLQMLKDLRGDGPAEDFAKNLAKGDFKQAAEQLKQLQDKLASGKMSEEDKKKLQEQLSEMKQQLEKLANLEQRKKQLDQALKNGGINKEQHEQQMAKLNDQAKDLRKLQKMASQMAKAADALKQGDAQKAADALGMSQQELHEMAKQAQELELLDSAMADLQDAKNGMAGDGMNQLGDQIAGANMLGQGDRPGNMGMGLGRGRGQGDRPEAADDTSLYDTKVKQQHGKGKAILESFVPHNKQMKGDSVITEHEAIETASGVAAEALSNQKVPKNVEKHVLGYFEQIRKGE